MIKDLGNGLRLRTASPSDATALAEFNTSIHFDDDTLEPMEEVGVWARDLLSKPHPTLQPEDFTLVEEIASGRIVSSLNLIPQTWSYAGIPFGVGRPELVGTLPEYRGRGLVRAQFEAIHQWCAGRGMPVQAITGIPYYYRQFGYEMVLDLDSGRRAARSAILNLAGGGEKAFRFRPARLEDLAFIARLYEIGCRRSLVSCLWDEALWRYELEGKSQKNINRCDLHIIENAGGEASGFLATPGTPWHRMSPALLLEAAPGVSYGALVPAVLRFLLEIGDEHNRRQGSQKETGQAALWLGAEHPAYHALPYLLGNPRQPYAWYLRVPDLPGFLRRIAPVLEQRLAGSPFSGHTGMLRLTFYRSGLRLAFAGGRLARAEAWQPAPDGHSGDAGFPGLTFLQLLFGYRRLEELRFAFADCFIEREEAAGLLEALFPKMVSQVWPVS